MLLKWFSNQIIVCTNFDVDSHKSLEDYLINHKGSQGHACFSSSELGLRQYLLSKLNK